MDTHLPVPLNHLLQRELEPDEEVAWRGQPRPRLFVGQDAPQVLFGFMVLISALVLLVVGARLTNFPGQGLSASFPISSLLGVAFLLGGVVVLGTTFLGGMRLRRTAYAITDRRVILLEDGRKRIVRSFTPSQFDEIQRTEHADGTGDLILTRRRWSDPRGRAQSEAVALLGVQEPQRVERLLRALAAARKA